MKSKVRIVCAIVVPVLLGGVAVGVSQAGVSDLLGLRAADNPVTAARSQVADIAGATGTSQLERARLTAALARVHVTVYGETLPSLSIEGVAMMSRHLPAMQDEPLTSHESLARAIATAASTSALYQAGVRDGLSISSKQINEAIDEQIRFYNAAKNPAPVPMGLSATQYFHSLSFRSWFVHNQIAAMEARAVTHMNVLLTEHDQQVQARRLKSWAAKQFAKHVVITGLPGVSGKNLVNYL
jgi:hypothetical protein